ncbi:hypothetical protein [Bartonella sp. TT119HLJHH]|uniref:hypothetical protein n=1 Tax=Bartonella sp. TT119HLJHH TaxID=3243579 RepID=UPI0035CEEB51
MFAGAFLFLLIVFIMRFVVTRQLNKLIRQLEEELEQNGDPVILYEVSEGKMSEGKMSEGKMSEGKVSKGKVSEGKVSKGKVSEGKVSEGKMSEGKK